MGNASDFEIKKGVLTKYTGKEAEVVIPEGIMTIGKKAFADHKKMAKVILPESVTSIEKGAFSGCKELADIELGSNITSIGEKAFAGCISLENITLPEQLESIGESAFSFCSGLKSITFPAGLKTIGKAAFCMCESLKKADISQSVTAIGDGAFEGCKKLADKNGLIIVKNMVFGGRGGVVEIPQGVREISAGAFSYNRRLTGITIPESVTVIGEAAFKGCDKLTNVQILGENVSIGKYAFSGCVGLLDQNDLIIVHGILYDYAGKGGEVVIPEGITTLEENAFLNCPVITKVTLPESLQKIGYMAFSGCTGLADEHGMVIVGSRLYNYYGTETDLTIPEHVTYIEDYAFRNCADLKRVSVPASVQGLSQYTFVGDIGSLKIYCSGKQFDALHKLVKESVILDWLGGNESYAPDQLAAMKKAAGKMLDSLFESIRGDDGAAVARLLGCAKVKPEKIEKYISKCNDGMHPAMLAVLLDYKERNGSKTENKNMDSFTLELPETLEQDWKKIYRWTEENGTITVTKYKGDDNRVVIPWNIAGVPVTKIGKNAFKGNINIEEILLGPEIVEIGEAAFEGCEKLAHIGWNEKLVTIGKRAFYGCYQLTVIRLPASVVELGVNSFSARFNFGDTPLMHLSEVYLPENIKVYKQFLGEFMDYCVDVHFLGKKTKITAKDFFAATVKLFVPAGSKTEEYARKAGLPFVAE